VSVQNEFSPAFSYAFDPPTPHKLLILEKGVDDHPRPRLPLWQRYHYQPTQIALLLYEDGRVIETETLYIQGYLDADDVVAGGRLTIYPPDAWQVGVLTAAGYTLIDAPAPDIYGGDGAP
jgi:hypothetical protein